MGSPKDYVVRYTGCGKVKASSSEPMTLDAANEECARLNQQLRENNVGGWHNVSRR